MSDMKKKREMLRKKRLRKNIFTVLLIVIVILGIILAVKLAFPSSKENESGKPDQTDQTEGPKTPYKVDKEKKSELMREIEDRKKRQEEENGQGQEGGPDGENEAEEDPGEETGNESEQGENDALSEEEKFASLPQELRERVEKYPWSKQETLKYLDVKDNPLPIDLEDEVKEGQIPLFLQYDARWGFNKVGEDYISVRGCGPVTLSMVYIGLTGDYSFDPIKAAEFANTNGYYYSGSGSARELFYYGAMDLGLNSEEVYQYEDEMKEKLDQGKVLVLLVGNGDFTAGDGHFIVIDGYTEDGFSVLDTNSPNNSSILWTFDQLEPQIKMIWAIWK